jgi:prevent-host-death family protein
VVTPAHAPVKVSTDVVTTGCLATRPRRKVVTPRGPGDSGPDIPYGETQMKSVGIREGKARLSELARAAADGETTVLTDYGKPIAVISPIEQTTKAESGSDADGFRKALLSLPYHLDFGF